jgi:PPM family protein phosphatase
MKHIHLAVSAETRQGSRTVNEDSFIVVERDTLSPAMLGLLVVADGIGGLGNGHVASSTAVTTVAQTFCDLAKRHCTGEPSILDWLAVSFQKANTALLQMGLALKELRGMGTTCTAAVLTETSLYVCHVGDSRAYIYREGSLKQITEDDWYRGLRETSGGPPPSAMKQKAPPSDNCEAVSGPDAKRRPEVTLVTQAIGWQPLINPAKIEELLQTGDCMLLCTDGLTDSLSVPEIERAIAGSGANACAHLTDEAASKPGADNVTVVIARLIS